MPITSSAIKAMRQSAKRRAARRPVGTVLKTMMRKLSDAVKEGKKAEAAALLPQVYKSIDMAAKKYLIHQNNAARKKSLASKLVARLK